MWRFLFPNKTRNQARKTKKKENRTYYQKNLQNQDTQHVSIKPSNYKMPDCGHCFLYIFEYAQNLFLIFLVLLFVDTTCRSLSLPKFERNLCKR